MNNRREFIKTVTTVTLAGMTLPRAVEAAAVPEAPPAPKATLPVGKIGDLEVSRLMLGGNVISQYTHSRDLRYVSALSAHYNTDEKILETLAVAEAHGVNAINMGNLPRYMRLLKQYRKLGGKMQWIIDVITARPGTEEYATQVNEMVDAGAEAIYLYGIQADALVAQGQIDVIAKAVQVAKDLGVPSGVGCHNIEVVTACEKLEIPADFYFVTFHHHNYPSGPKPDQLNGPLSEGIPAYWCRYPQQVIEVMRGVEKPWVAFKILAAGAIPPKDAFRYAFENGADHALVGMFDWQIAEDVALVNSVLPTVKRSRPWRS